MTLDDECAEPLHCAIALNPTTIATSPEEQARKHLITHEILHCYQHEWLIGRYGAFNKGHRAFLGGDPYWSFVREGTADWFGHAVTGYPPTGQNWRGWFGEPGRVLMDRSYDAVGFWTYVDSAFRPSPSSDVAAFPTPAPRGGLFDLLQPLTLSDHPLSFITTQLAPEQWTQLASRQTRQARLGPEWDWHGSGTPDINAIPPREPTPLAASWRDMADAGTAFWVAPGTQAYIRWDPTGTRRGRGTLVLRTPLPGVAKWDGGDTLDVKGSEPVRWCWGEDCTCGEPLPRDGSLHIAVTAFTTGHNVELDIEPCDREPSSEQSCADNLTSTTLKRPIWGYSGEPPEVGPESDPDSLDDSTYGVVAYAVIPLPPLELSYQPSDEALCGRGGLHFVINEGQGDMTLGTRWTNPGADPDDSLAGSAALVCDDSSPLSAEPSGDLRPGCQLIEGEMAGGWIAGGWTIRECETNGRGNGWSLTLYYRAVHPVLPPQEGRLGRDIVVRGRAEASGGVDTGRCTEQSIRQNEAEARAMLDEVVEAIRSTGPVSVEILGNQDEGVG
jgi:hypothetical protein